jgi:hypothetical protein
VTATPNGLLAIGQRRIWASTDGRSWTPIDTQGWRYLWDPARAELSGVASGSSGTIAIGTDLGSGQSIVVQSGDGRSWRPVELPAAEFPIVRDVAAYPGGFVVVGRDGQPDGEASSDHPAVVPGMGRATAWFSSDGLAWTESAVEADRVQGGTLTDILVGSGGLFALGINAGGDYYAPTDYAAGDTVTAWASSDGSSWEIVGELGMDLPPMALLASDGTNMVGLGLRQPWVGQDPTAWASLDGVHWSALGVNSPAPDVHYLVLDPQLYDGPPDTALWVLPDGLLALGRGDGVPIDGHYASQWFRFAAAATR